MGWEQAGLLYCACVNEFCCGCVLCSVYSFSQHAEYVVCWVVFGRSTTVETKSKPQFCASGSKEAVMQFWLQDINVPADEDNTASPLPFSLVPAVSVYCQGGQYGFSNLNQLAWSFKFFLSFTQCPVVVSLRVVHAQRTIRRQWLWLCCSSYFSLFFLHDVHKQCRERRWALYWPLMPWFSEIVEKLDETTWDAPCLTARLISRDTEQVGVLSLVFWTLLFATTFMRWWRCCPQRGGRFLRHLTVAPRICQDFGRIWHICFHS